MKLPDVFAYLDYRTFLSDWLDARKRADPTYSYATFARDGGCSKAALANVVRGERSPRPETLDAFGRAMSLTPAARNYLGMLVELDTERDGRKRLAAMERLLSNERFGQFRNADRQPVADVDRYLEHWWIPAIREMVALPGFQEDPQWIASHLRPPITVDQASDALEALEALDFVARDGTGKLVQKEIRFGTDPDTWQIAVTRFYREQIPALLEALDVGQSGVQEVLAATISLEADTIAEAKVRLFEMVTQLATVADSRPRDAPAAVYQVVVMMVPISGVVGDPEDRISDGGTVTG
ncbi:MAG: TIGR02147 family protein [Myxococcota bacterium]